MKDEGGRMKCISDLNFFHNLSLNTVQRATEIFWFSLQTEFFNNLPGRRKR